MLRSRSSCSAARSPSVSCMPPVLVARSQLCWLAAHSTLRRVGLLWLRWLTWWREGAYGGAKWCEGEGEGSAKRTSGSPVVDVAENSAVLRQARALPRPQGSGDPARALPGVIRRAGVPVELPASLPGAVDQRGVGEAARVDGGDAASRRFGDELGSRDGRRIGGGRHRQARSTGDSAIHARVRAP